MERGEVKIMLKYIPYILLFALVTMIIYAWGLWRSMRQQQDLSNLLSAKGISKIAVTDPGKFLGSILPYMINQKLISETQKNGKAVYQLRK